MKYPLTPGQVVEHRYATYPLVIVSGPERGIRGEVYRVRTPEGKIEPVLRENLKI
jgi:hypothetical protein